MIGLLLEQYGTFPGAYFRLPPGERAAVCALLIDRKLQREEDD